MDGWLHNISENCPVVIHSQFPYPVPCASWILDPNKILIHPGPAQQSVVRWTAPENHEINLSAHWMSLDIGAKIVHVYHNGSELFSAELDYLGQTADYSSDISCQAGDVIDCAIDPISFYYDSTELDLILQTVEPSPVSERTWRRTKVAFH